MSVTLDVRDTTLVGLNDSTSLDETAEGAERVWIGSMEDSGVMGRVILEEGEGRTGDTGLTSSSASKGDLDTGLRGSRANSSLKIFGFERLRTVALLPEEEVDCREFRGDMLCMEGAEQPGLARAFQSTPGSTERVLMILQVGSDLRKSARIVEGWIESRSGMD